MTSAQFHIPTLREEKNGRGREKKRDCVAPHGAPPPWIDEMPVSCSELNAAAEAEEERHSDKKARILNG